MENVSVRDAYYQEGIVEAGKGKTAGYAIAWILAAIFILAILFWVFNRASCNHNDMMYRTGDHNCATRERLGILEGEMRSVGTVLGQLIPKVSSLSEFTAAQLGGLQEYTRCSEKQFGQVEKSLYSIDRAVFTSRCGCDRDRDRDGGCGCGRDGGRRFSETSTFAPVSSQVTVTETCRN